MQLNDEIRWFACLCVDQEVINERGLRLILQSFEKDQAIDIIPFAEKIYQTGACDDAELLQELIISAGYQVHQKNSPPFDPFEIRSSGNSVKPWVVGDTPLLFST